MVVTLQKRPLHLQPPTPQGAENQDTQNQDTQNKGHISPAQQQGRAIDTVAKKTLLDKHSAEKEVKVQETPKETKTSSGFFGSIVNIASSVGTKVTSYGKQALSFTYHSVPGVKFCTKKALDVSATVGRACYLNVPGVKTCTQYFVNKAVNRLLPQEGTLRDQIEEHKKNLKKATHSSILSQSCSLIADFITGFVRNQIVNGKEMDESLRSPLVKTLLHTSFGGHTEYGLLGDVLKTAFQSHPDLAKEIIEANLLKAFCNVIDTLCDAEKKNGHWLVDLVSDILKGYTDDIQQFQENRHREIPASTHTPDFHKLAKILLNAAFPQGAKSLDLPLVGASYISELLMKELEEAILPKICKNLYEIATSEYAKDKLILYFFTLLKEFISTGAVRGKEPDHQGDLAIESRLKEHVPYEKTDEFNVRLSHFADTFLHFIDPVFAHIFAKLDVKSLIIKHGHLVIQSVASIGMAEGLNWLVKLALPLLNKGTWEEREKLLTFQAAPFEYFTKETEEAAELAFKKRNHEDIRRQTEHILHTLMDDFSGISAIGVQSLFQAPSEKEINDILEKGDLIEHFRLCAWLLLVNAAKEIIKLIFWVLGKARVEQTTHLLYERANTMSLQISLRPLSTLLIAKISHQGA